MGPRKKRRVTARRFVTTVCGVVAMEAIDHASRATALRFSLALLDDKRILALCVAIPQVTENVIRAGST